MLSNVYFSLHEELLLFNAVADTSLRLFTREYKGLIHQHDHGDTQLLYAGSGWRSLEEIWS